MKKVFLASLFVALFVNLAGAACNPWYQYCSQSEIYAKTCWNFDGKNCLCCNAHRYISVGGEPVCKNSYIWVGKIHECLAY